MQILLYVLIFYFGLVCGILIRMWLSYVHRYTGTILVSKDGDKIVYSLVLEDDPENLQFQEEAVFKVDLLKDVPDENLIRE